MTMKRMMSVSVAAAGAAFAAVADRRRRRPGLRPRQRRPQAAAGILRAVVADNVGRARHLAVAPNGDLYVSTRNGGRGATGGVVALHDNDGDGKMDSREHFGSDGATGVALRNGYVYYGDDQLDRPLQAGRRGSWRRTHRPR